jgi:hypothetical protein
VSRVCLHLGYCSVLLALGPLVLASIRDLPDCYHSEAVLIALISASEMFCLRALPPQLQTASILQMQAPFDVH